MKENKRIIYISIMVCFITLLISIYLYFFKDSNVSNYISNILLNIFASSCVVIGTSLVYYFVERKKVLEHLMDYCIKLERLFSKIEFLSNIDYEDNELSKIKFSKKEFKQFEKVMRQYVEVIEYDLSEFYSIYNRIDFLIGNSKKYEIHKKIFDYTMNLRKEISKYVRHFIIYFESNSGNKEVNYDFLMKVQPLIFDIENYKLKDIDYKNIKNKDFQYYCENYDKNICCFAKNKVSEHYLSMVDYIGQIAYNKKDYTYIQESEKE